ncbi:MAG: methionine/alanine import family NSS transporter small subunit [Pseudoclavibacter sp.]|nr:methionine/alanine import family NSS transporter small subunit [Pseudoclavibacter sp.]
MNAEAVIMLVVAVCTVWGGLVAAVVNLVRNPEDRSE